MHTMLNEAQPWKFIQSGVPDINWLVLRPTGNIQLKWFQNNVVITVTSATEDLDHEKPFSSYLSVSV